MLPKTFTLKTPIDDFAVPLEMFLTSVSKGMVQFGSGAYTGTGKTLAVAIPFYPQLVILAPFIDIGRAGATTAGNMVFSLASNPGISWVPATGFVKDCVTSLTKTTLTLGVNTNVNMVSKKYIYLIFG